MPTSSSTAAPARSFFAKLGGGALVLVMIVASLMLWLGFPILWLWIGSMMVDSSEPSMGPYALVFFGIVVSVIATAKFLSRANRAYMNVSGTHGTVRLHVPWLRSMRDEKESDVIERSALDIILVCSFVLAAAIVGVWFLIFAGPPPGEFSR